MRTVKPNESAEANLNEIYNTGFQLAFVSPENEQCHAWVLCKDFMNDVVWSQIHGEKVGIYGFSYDPSVNPNMSMDPVKIVVRDKEREPQEFDRVIKQSVKFLNIVERQHGFPESKAERVLFGKTDQRVWMFTCPPCWIHASPMLSLLTLYIRIGCHYPGGGSMNRAISYYRNEVEHNDSGYLKESRQMRLLILKRGLSIFRPKMEDNYPKDADLHTVHHSWGIVNSPRQEQLQKLWDLKELSKMGKNKKTQGEAAIREDAVIKE